MPKMYAYNTSATQIKKRYAMIGSTATQIKKKYAMIGSTATLVYSAETQLFPSSLTFTKGGTNTAGSVSDTALTAKASWNKTYGAISLQVDVTDFSKIIFTVSERTSTEKVGSTTVGVSDRQYPSSFDSYGDNNGVATAVTKAGTYEVDVSNLSGKKYVALSAWTSSGDNSITVTKIMAE